MGEKKGREERKRGFTRCVGGLTEHKKEISKM